MLPVGEKHVMLLFMAIILQVNQNTAVLPADDGSRPAVPTASGSCVSVSVYHQTGFSSIHSITAAYLSEAAGALVRSNKSPQ